MTRPASCVMRRSSHRHAHTVQVTFVAMHWSTVPMGNSSPLGHVHRNGTNPPLMNKTHKYEFCSPLSRTISCRRNVGDCFRRGFILATSTACALWPVGECSGDPALVCSEARSRVSWGGKRLNWMLSHA